MEDFIIALVLIIIGCLNLFFSIRFLRKPDYAENYIKKNPKAFLLRKILGEEKAYKITKKVFVPLGIIISSLLILGGLLFLFLYFSPSITGGVVNDYTEGSQNEGIFYLESNDTRILRAKEEAQNEIDYFINSLNANSHYTYGIKTPFEEQENAEHMWVFIDSYSDGKFYGELASQPEVVTNYKEGDKVIILKGDVEDWAILDEKGQVIKGDFLDKILEGTE